MSIAAAIIAGLAGITTTLITGKMQSDILEEGQVESRQIRLEDIGEARKTRKAQEKLTREGLKEGRRQFDLSYGLQKETVGMQREQYARESFRDQVSRLTKIVDKNKNLENILINRMAGLRRR